MKGRRLVLVGIVVAVVTVAWVPMASQAQQAGGTTVSANWTPPRTPWGDPDLQGIWGGSGGRVYLERPEKWKGREFLTNAEVAEWEAKLYERNVRQGQGLQENVGDGNQANYNAIVAWSPGRPRVDRRTTAIIDPPDGLLPPWTLAQLKHWEAREAATVGRGDADWTTDRIAAERCIAEFGIPFVPQWGMGFGAGPPVSHQGRSFEEVEDNPDVNPLGDLQSPYAGGPGNLRFLQAPGYVAITDAGSRQDYHIIPLDGRPHLDKQFRQHLGDQRGHWEGNTLVVETTNLKYVSDHILTSHGRGSTYPGSAATLRIIQRYTPVSADTMEYTATVEDPAVWTRPWTVAYPMSRRSNDNKPAPIACREGIDDMGTVLYGWRLDEAGAMYINHESRETRQRRFEKVKERAMEAAKRGR